MKCLTVLIAMFLSLSATAGNLQLIDQDKNSGFAFYRMGKPSVNDMREICNLGIMEMAVLSGNAMEFEYAYKHLCPNLEVVYNKEQNAYVTLSKEFLEDFDAWIAQSKKEGKKVAIRCNCGCHRTGRLAAYYEMKYLGKTAAEAIKTMKSHGKNMFWHPDLDLQVKAMEKYIKREKCPTLLIPYCIR